MSKRYTGGVVSSSLPTVDASGASGVFFLSQQADYQSRNAWPPYKIEKSLRFRSSASAFLSRTPSVVGNRKTWTWSAWLKRSNPSANGTLFAARTAVGATYFVVSFQSAGDFRIESNSETAYPLYKTNALFRDPSAWYHVVVALDMTQATSTDRLKVWVNNVLQTTASYNVPAQNTDLAVNSTETHLMGQQASGNYFDGYMAEVNFIDGQALTPSSFGATDKDGVWVPKLYTGSYGTNGFYLNFKDATSTSTVGYDYSGNGNNWASSGISVTAGTTYDSMIDVPVDQSDGTANNRGNYCVLNPLNKQSSATVTDGNLALATASVGYGSTVGTMGVSSGKWYWEQTYVAGSDCFVGVVKDGFNVNTATYLGNDAYSYSYYNNPARAYNNGSYVTYGATYTTGDIIGVALDLDNGTLVFYKNGVSQGTAFTGLSGTFFPAASDGNNAATASYVLNFGQRPFIYAPPSGFKALNTFNLPEPTIKQPNQYFDALLYTGNGSSLQRTDISWTNMQPDMVWIKNRTTANNHVVHDVIRGPAFALQPNLADATDGPVGFGSDGFGSDTGVANQLRIFTTDGRYNLNNNSYVAWGWKGTSSNTTNTSGSITSIIRANQTAGFSIVTYTGTGSAATVGHGLGVAPSMYIVKSRSLAGENWIVYHTSLGNAQQLNLNTTAAQAASTNFNSTSPTSSVFSIGSGTAVNSSTNTYVAYCFAQIAGYSAFGSYTGNGSSDGPFIYTGFRPKFVLIKYSSGIDNWAIFDTSRIGYNADNNELQPNTTTAEGTADFIDILSNGFKNRNSDARCNASGGTYIYAAFAEMPFKYARAR